MEWKHAIGFSAKRYLNAYAHLRKPDEMYIPRNHREEAVAVIADAIDEDETGKASIADLLKYFKSKDWTDATEKGIDPIKLSFPELKTQSNSDIVKFLTNEFWKSYLKADACLGALFFLFLHHGDDSVLPGLNGMLRKVNTHTLELVSLESSLPAFVELIDSDDKKRLFEGVGWGIKAAIDQKVREAKEDELKNLMQ